MSSSERALIGVIVFGAVASLLVVVGYLVATVVSNDSEATRAEPAYEVGDRDLTPLELTLLADRIAADGQLEDLGVHGVSELPGESAVEVRTAANPAEVARLLDERFPGAPIEVREAEPPEDG